MADTLELSKKPDAPSQQSSGAVVVRGTTPIPAVAPKRERDNNNTTRTASTSSNSNKKRRRPFFTDRGDRRRRKRQREVFSPSASSLSVSHSLDLSLCSVYAWRTCRIKMYISLRSVFLLVYDILCFHFSVFMSFMSLFPGLPATSHFFSCFAHRPRRDDSILRKIAPSLAAGPTLDLRLRNKLLKKRNRKTGKPDSNKNANIFTRYPCISRRLALFFVLSSLPACPNLSF